MYYMSTAATLQKKERHVTPGGIQIIVYVLYPAHVWIRAVQDMYRSCESRTLSFMCCVFIFFFSPSVLDCPS